MAGLMSAGVSSLSYKEMIIVILTHGVVRASIVTEKFFIVPKNDERTKCFHSTTTGYGNYQVRANKDGYYAIVTSRQLIKDAKKVFYNAGDLIDSGGPSENTVYRCIVAF